MRFVRHSVNRLLRRVMLGSGIGVLKLSAEKKTRQVQLSLLAGMVRDAVNNPEPYGFTARPLAGALLYWLALGGDLNKLTALIASDPRHRPTDLLEGEVCLYTDEGDEIRLKRGRIIAVTCGGEVQITAANKITATAPAVDIIASTKVLLDTPNCEITGNLSVGGTGVVNGALSSATSVSDPDGSMSEMRDTFNTHTHGGVTTGGANTLVPNQSMD